MRRSTSKLAAALSAAWLCALAAVGAAEPPRRLPLPDFRTISPLLRASDPPAPSGAPVAGTVSREQIDRWLQELDRAGLSPQDAGFVAGGIEYVFRNHVSPPLPEELLQGAIDGVARKLDPSSARYSAMKGVMEKLDRYSRFLNPQESARRSRGQAGQRTSDGMSFKRKIVGEPLVVDWVRPGSPAHAAGIREEDRITAVNGSDVVALGPENVLSAFPEGARVGARVVFRVQGAGRPDPVDVPVILEELRVDKAVGRRLGNVGYVHLGDFNENSFEHLGARLAALRAGPLDGLIVDLRGNGGGRDSNLMRIAAHFLPDRTHIMTGETRDETRMMTAMLQAGQVQLLGVPLVVLVDHETASAAEVLAAALQDHGRAVVVGTRTFGKFSGQSTLRFNDGSTGVLTTDRWRSPRGRTVQGGLAPDVEVTISREAQASLSRILDDQLEGREIDLRSDPFVEAALAALQRR